VGSWSKKFKFEGSRHRCYCRSGLPLGQATNQETIAAKPEPIEYEDGQAQDSTDADNVTSTSLPQGMNQRWDY